MLDVLGLDGGGLARRCLTSSGSMTSISARTSSGATAAARGVPDGPVDVLVVLVLAVLVVVGQGSRGSPNSRVTRGHLGQ